MYEAREDPLVGPYLAKEKEGGEEGYGDSVVTVTVTTTPQKVR